MLKFFIGYISSFFISKYLKRLARSGMKDASVISVADPDVGPHGSPLILVGWDLDPDTIVQKCPTKIGKSEEISCFEEPVFFFQRAEGFLCSLDVLYGGLGITQLQFLNKNVFLLL
jgi:hypothetical protein